MRNTFRPIFMMKLNCLNCLGSVFFRNNTLFFIAILFLFFDWAIKKTQALNNMTPQMTPVLDPLGGK